jgi:hypothetical protein
MNKIYRIDPIPFILSKRPFLRGTIHPEHTDLSYDCDPDRPVDERGQR